MLIKLPEGFGHRIHWEQFGIYHLTRGCREIPSQMWFTFTLSVRHRWGREGGEGGFDPKSLESQRLPDSGGWSTEGVGGGRKRRSNLVLEKHSRSPRRLQRQEQLRDVAPAVSPRDKSQLQEGRTLPAAGNVGMGPWLELAPGTAAALAPALPWPPPRRSHPEQAGAARQRTSTDFIDIKRAI